MLEEGKPEFINKKWNVIHEDGSRHIFESEDEARIFSETNPSNRTNSYKESLASTQLDFNAIAEEDPEWGAHNTETQANTILISRWQDKEQEGQEKSSLPVPEGEEQVPEEGRRIWQILPGGAVFTDFQKALATFRADAIRIGADLLREEPRGSELTPQERKDRT